MTRIYEQLNTKTLGDVEAIDIQALQDKVHIQEINIQELKTYNLINQAAHRTGQVMPDKGTLYVFNQPTNDDQLIIRPPKGQVWDIMGVSVANTAALSGNQAYYLYYSTDASIAASPIPVASTDMLLSSISSSSTTVGWETLSEDNAPRTLYATYDIFPRFYANFGGVGVGESVNWIVAYVRRY